MEQNFKDFINALETEKYDSDFAKDIIECGSISFDFAKDIFAFCKEKDIKPLSQYSQQEAVETFQLLADYCCQREIYYGLAEHGDGTVYNL